MYVRISTICAKYTRPKKKVDGLKPSFSKPDMMLHFEGCAWYLSLFSRAYIPVTVDTQFHQLNGYLKYPKIIG